MADTDDAALVAQFEYERTLNQDQAGRRTALYGAIAGKPALLVLERAPFPTAEDYRRTVAARLRLRALGVNDIYHWYMGGEVAGGDDADNDADNADNAAKADNDADNNAADNAALKVNLIYPCTEQHVRKYSRQGVRVVAETPALYRERVQPWVQAQRAAGRLAWVDNILAGRQEAADVVARTPLRADTPDGAAGPVNEDGFVLLPDLNWDRATLEALHLLALVERRDLASLRDLRRRHVPWLRRLRQQLVDAAVAAYGPSGLAADQLKLYVHYQPTYYHFHVHVVHAQLEAGATQATGKAVGLESLTEQLAHMGGPDDDDDAVGMHQVTLTYTLGEASELWGVLGKEEGKEGKKGEGKEGEGKEGKEGKKDKA